jgi:hypothetical protein
LVGDIFIDERNSDKKVCLKKLKYSKNCDCSFQLRHPKKVTLPSNGFVDPSLLDWLVELWDLILLVCGSSKSENNYHFRNSQKKKKKKGLGNEKSTIRHKVTLAASIKYQAMHQTEQLSLDIP